MSNSISIFRKRVKTNIPGFADVSAQTQNEWVKLADYSCVEYCPAETSRTYQAEHAPNYSNQEDTSYYEFSFESFRQEFNPPYDINTGDYIGFKQGTSIFFYRIVKVTSTSILKNCCVVQIVINITQPREVQHLVECGYIESLEEDELQGGVIDNNSNGVIRQ